LQALGWSAETLAFIGILKTGIVSPAGMTGILLGGIALWASATLAWTPNNLQQLYNAVNEASNGGTNGITLSAGTNIIKWGISVNGTEVMSQYTIHPWITPKGYCTLAPHWLMIWYLFDR